MLNHGLRQYRLKFGSFCQFCASTEDDTNQHNWDKVFGLVLRSNITKSKLGDLSIWIDKTNRSAGSSLNPDYSVCQLS